MLPLWVIEFIKKNFRYRFFYASLTRIPLIGSIIEHMFFQNDNLVYLPKDSVMITVNQEIPFENTVLPSQIVHKFIEEAETHFIMDFCICRDSNECEDYPIDLGCLFMGEAAAKIDQRLGRLVSREEAHQHINRADMVGLVHLIGRNKLDTVWLDTGPGEKLLTVCNCCPCCCLWKMLPNLNEKISERISAMDGVSVSISGSCVACGVCVDSCFVGAISIEDGCARISDDCRGCGRCVEVCPEKAITLSVDSVGYESTVRRIGASVDV